MKRIALWAVVGVLAVTACAPQSAATPTPVVVVVTATPTSPPPSTAAPAPTSAPQQITREMVFQPQPGEWVRGPDTALVTIIEWGDFQ